MRRRRILVHAQHLSGVGHLVRGLEIARAAARDHEVFFASGGREVARPAAPERVETVALPAIARGAGGLEPLGGGGRPALEARAAALAEAAAAIAPDVLVVEHYPFSKWDLEPELCAAIEAARRANPAVAVVCSVRDVPRQTRHEDVPAAAWAERVVATLNDRFDALLVHADPAFTTLGEHLAGASAIRIPVFHTGFVSEKPRDGSPPPALAAAVADGRGLVAVSSGGGAGSAGFAERVLEAWSQLAARGATGRRRLAVFTGAFWSDAETARIGCAAAAQGALAVPFRGDFLRWLARCDLSISRAGYNTCTNVLELRVRALLVPDPRMSDQGFRAARMAERGLAGRLDAESAGAEALGGAIAAALGSEPPVHDLDLDGAARTSELLAHLGPARTGRS